MTRPVRVVVGHANPDFDAYAATVAATKLFPGAKGVFLGTQNVNVRSFHNLHEEFLDFVDLKGLDLDDIDSVVMVDTRDPDRIGELGAVVTREGVDVIIYDHHPPQEGDLACADDRSMEVGATTSILVHEIRARALELSPLEASVMLLGIHEDTGSLTYPGTTAYDAEAAAYLLAAGADIEVLNQFLARTLDAAQQKLLQQLQAGLRLWNVNGQQVAVGTAVADEYVDSASVLTHYVVEDMGYRVAIAVVKMPERLQIVARSRLAEVDVGKVMTRLGGGGHAQAASAGFRDLSVDDALKCVRDALEAEVRSPLHASDIMSAPVRGVGAESTMKEAAELMSRWGHGGLPILDGDHILGMVTRKDVDKAARHGLDHAPVTGFMGREVVSVTPDLDVSELERLLATRGIGRVPVVADGKLVGIVTRKDVLRAEHGDAYLDRRLSRAHPEATDRFLTNVARLLPAEARQALELLGEIAAKRGQRAHVVGGFVRDMVLGRTNLDIDIVIEGDGVDYAEYAASVMGVRVKVHRRFGTAILVLDRNLHIDIASSRSEYYARPGALPTVEQSTLRQDLLRRDFTINAMAACVDPDCFGQIADPFGGLKDVDRGAIRVLHGLSFVDDPTRVLRAARFEERYGFTMDETTEALARHAVGMGMLSEVSGARVREELIDIIDEPQPGAVLRRLESLGALGELTPDGLTGHDIVLSVESAIDALKAVSERLPEPPRLRAGLIAAIAGWASRQAAERWLRHFRFGREYAEPALALANRGPAVLRALQDRRGMRDSRLYRLLQPLPPEAVALLWGRANKLGRDRIEHYLDELTGVKAAVNGRDLLQLGYEPSEQFTAILARALDERLDGRAVGREAELANLKRIAQRRLSR
ncbi:MAG TPA: CBS domain-containing protein [Coriobacteriia bacterium]|nr:CBS domain-containing protein [Coriobacteriia bacterium]